VACTEGRLALDGGSAPLPHPGLQQHPQLRTATCAATVTSLDANTAAATAAATIATTIAAAHSRTATCAATATSLDANTDAATAAATIAAAHSHTYRYMRLRAVSRRAGLLCETRRVWLCRAKLLRREWALPAYAWRLPWRWPLTTEI
jgi:hypothetical protein